MGREEAYEQIRTLFRELDSADSLHEKNEAETRLQVIDEVLQHLGWEKSEFNPEKSTEDGFIDYCLTLEGIPRLIVEAKSVDRTFGPTQRGFHKYRYSFSYLKSAFGKPMMEVVHQAERYAKSEGVPFGLVTNGKQWILLRLLDVGDSPPSDSDALYFGSLDEEEFNFELFWTYVSKSAVEQGALEENLASLSNLEAEKVWHPTTRLGELSWKVESSIEHRRFLTDFYRRFFGEIVDPGRRRMLEYCFVTNDELNQYRGELKRVLRDTPPTYLKNSGKLEKRTGPDELIKRSGDKKGDVVIVVGSVGAGKTTFVQKVLVEWRRTDAPLKSFRVNLIDEGRQPQAIGEDELWDLVFEIWNEEFPAHREYAELRSIFDGEIKGLREGPKKKLFDSDEKEFIEAEAELLEQLANTPRKFLERCWRYLQARSQGVVVFLDNIDRASPKYQETTYAFAHKLARMTGATVILTLRESTYYRGREGDFLDVRSNDRVYHLSAPNMRQVVSKRIKFIEERLEEDHRIKRWRAEDHWPEFESAAHDFAEELKQSLLDTEADREVVELLTATAWHNVRQFLELLNYVHRALGGVHERWRSDEVLAVLCCRRSEFDSATIPVAYEPTHPRFPTYAIRIRVLYYLQVGVPTGQTRSGVSYRRILDFARRYGYLKHWIDNTIETMVQERSLECVDIPAAPGFTKEYTLGKTHSFRPSPLGILVTNTLQHGPVYLTLSGMNIPYQDSTQMQKFIDQFEGILEGSDRELGSAGVELVSDSRLPSIVASYIIERLNEERLISKRLESMASLEAVEYEVRKALIELKAVADEYHSENDAESTRSAAVSNGFEESLQLTFFDEGQSDSEVERHEPSIESPHNILEAQYGRSTHLPKVLWVLVDAYKNDELPLRGAEITRRANRYLLPEHQQAEPTNISRVLRRPTAMNADWLDILDAGGHKEFDLTDAWPDAWREIFDEDPPTE